MPAPQTFRSGALIGEGGYGCVHDAVEVSSGLVVALKKSRVSQKVKRPHLQYESRILWLLQGHPAIPTIFAYAHLPHFEYMAIELLGPSLKDSMNELKEPVSTTTGARVVLQMLSALDHIHAHGFVHRDIKPDNILCSLKDPSKVVLIDFGIARGIAHGDSAQTDSEPDPHSTPKWPVGSLHWASLNAYHGLTLGPRDDLESLAFTGLFLVRGHLPWRNPAERRAHPEPMERMLQRVYAAKAGASGNGAALGAHFPPPFGGLLEYSRHLAPDHKPDYADWRERFAALDPDIAADPLHMSATPLDWTVVDRVVDWLAPVSDMSASTDSTEHDQGPQVQNFDESESSSYFDIYGEFEIQGPCDESLTLPAAKADLADSGIPPIAKVVLPYGADQQLERPSRVAQCVRNERQSELSIERWTLNTQFESIQRAFMKQPKWRDKPFL